MILRNEKPTTWQDTIENLILAAKDEVFSKRKRDDGCDLVSEDHGVAISVSRNTAWTYDKAVVDEALKMGYWVDEGLGGEYEILITYTKSPATPPAGQPNAHHITRTVIPLSQAEKRWGKQNLRQIAEGRPDMWKAGPRNWFTTEQAMLKLYGPELKI